jgi:Zn-finger nucleic acid-binding protein
MAARSPGAARCGRCQGWWLLPEAMSERGARLAADLVVVGSTNPRSCPSCALPMSTYRSPRVEIDACDQCQGVFLDRGELELLQDRRPSVKRVVEPPPKVYPASEDPQAADRGSSAGSATDSVLDRVAGSALLEGGVEVVGAVIGAIFELW